MNIKEKQEILAKIMVISTEVGELRDKIAELEKKLAEAGKKNSPRAKSCQK